MASTARSSRSPCVAHPANGSRGRPTARRRSRRSGGRAVSADPRRSRIATERLDPLAIISALVERQVSFVVIGGVAGLLHGGTTLTEDVDIAYERSVENLERLAGVLADLGAYPRGVEPGLPFRPDARTLRNGLNFTFVTRHGNLDCLGEASGGYTYAVLAPNAERYDLDGIVVAAASLDDLIRMKRAAGRRKDLIEVENLSALRDERQSRH